MPSKTSSKTKVSTESTLSKNDVEAIDELRQSYAEIKIRTWKDHHWARASDRTDVSLHAIPGARPPYGCSRISQDSPRQLDISNHLSFLRSNSIHPGSYAFRRNGYGNPAKQKGWRGKGIRLHQRTDFRQRHFGGRDQSDSTENSVRPP